MSGLSVLKLMMIERIKMMQTAYLDIWSMLLWTISASYKLFKSLVLDTQRFCASSNTVLEENNLPPIMYWLFS